MIAVTDRISLRDDELRVSFVLASGPGGQNVNKLATAAQLRFDAAGSPSLPVQVRERLLRLAGRRRTREGEIIIEAKRFRSQERNRQDAIERLIALVRRAAEPPKPRRKTKPPRAAKERRLEDKRRQAAKKRRRGEAWPD